MSTITGAVMRVVRSGRGLLPSGQLLTPEIWERRHRGIVWLLWLHMAGLATFAVIRGYRLLHGLQEAMLVAVFTVPAAHTRSPGGPARRRPCSA
jgi:purine-cytosine permease-like protein